MITAAARARCREQEPHLIHLHSTNFVRLHHLPHPTCAVLMYTAKSAPLRIRLALQMWCLGTPTQQARVVRCKLVRCSKHCREPDEEKTSLPKSSRISYGTSAQSFTPSASLSAHLHNRSVSCPSSPPPNRTMPVLCGAAVMAKELIDLMSSTRSTLCGHRQQRSTCEGGGQVREAESKVKAPPSQLPVMATPFLIQSLQLNKEYSLDSYKTLHPPTEPAQGAGAHLRPGFL